MANTIPRARREAIAEGGFKTPLLRTSARKKLSKSRREPARPERGWSRELFARPMFVREVVLARARPRDAPRRCVCMYVFRVFTCARGANPYLPRISPRARARGEKLIARY